MAQVNFNAVHLGQQFLVDEEGKTGLLLALVIVGGGVQSQREARAASAAGGEVNADGGFVFVGEERIQFFLRIVGNINHTSLRLYY